MKRIQAALNAAGLIGLASLLLTVTGWRWGLIEPTWTRWADVTLAIYSLIAVLLVVRATLVPSRRPTTWGRGRVQ